MGCLHACMIDVYVCVWPAGVYDRYVYVRVCMCVCSVILSPRGMYACVLMHICMCVCVLMHICMCVFVLMHIYFQSAREKHARMYVCIYVCMYVMLHIR